MKAKAFSDCPNYMKQNVVLLLFRDFFSRSPWSIPTFVLLLLLSFISVQYSKLGFLMLLPSFYPEQLFGVTKIYQTLSVSRKTLTRYLWFKDVLFFPVIYFTSFIILLPVFSPLLSHWGIPAGYNTVQNVFFAAVWLAGFYSVGIYWGVGLYWNILYFLLAVPFFLDIFFFVNNDILSNTLLAVSPLLLILSYCFRDHRLAIPISQNKQHKNKGVLPVYSNSCVLFWLQFYFERVLTSMIIFIGIVLGSFTVILLGSKDALLEDVFSILVFTPAFFGSVFSMLWINEMRPVRTLPMTFWGQALFVISIPLFNILFTSVIVLILTIMLGMRDESILLLEAACFGFGLSVILLNAIPRFGISFVGIIVFLPVFTAFFIDRYLFFGIFVIGLMMFPLFPYQIKNSSKMYKRSIPPIQGGYMVKK